MEAVDNTLRAGDRLDRYELLCPIASGGMASVWLARLRGKRGFEKLFAVKTIRTELVEDPRFQEMFLDEARITSAIQHPNVAQILDLGEEKDVLFIVMEWIDGDSLAKIRKLVAKSGGRIPVGPALRIFADACAGLHAAHELEDGAGRPLGIVHRDVSPQNLLVSAAGVVKVIDFGIAKAQNRRQGETRTGVVKGKLQYMAPEQVKKGRSVDRRADVWAIGVCLHETVAGRLPNEGDDDVEVIRKLLADEAPVFAEGLPEPITRLLARSIAIDPDQRFPTAAAMQRAIEGAMKELGAVATSEDVASFVASALPDLTERRRMLVGQAISRSREGGAPESEPREEVAFAPTIVSDRTSAHRSGSFRDDARAIALTKRKSGGLRVATQRTAGPPGAVSPEDEEPFEIPKRSRLGLWAALSALLVGGGVIALRESPRPHESVRAPARAVAPAMRHAGSSAQPAAIAAPPSPARGEPAPAADLVSHVRVRFAAPPASELRPPASAAAVGGKPAAASRDAGLEADRDGGASALAPPPSAGSIPDASAESAGAAAGVSPEDNSNNPYGGGDF